MLALRYIALLALVLWIGGLVALGGFAAPAIFGVIGARDPAGGRLLAGAVFGETLGRFFLLTYAAGAILLLAMIARAVLGPRPRRFAWRAGLACVMLLSTLYSGLVLVREIDGVQAQIGDRAPSSLPADNPLRLEFGRLHAATSGLQVVPLLGGLALLYWEAKE
ncbi:MAG TPA: DUF4149 domain-containing protein [Vicinamibacterales bacterium]|nr:DUF4149 domain-containing protein [Vicinamibacterales bacterium]